MPASSRLCAYATCSLAASPVPTPFALPPPPPPPARLLHGPVRELALGRRPRRLAVAGAPARSRNTEVEIEAEEEGRDAGNRVEVEAGGAEADHLVVMVNGLYGSSADWKFAAEQFVKRLPGKSMYRSECNHSRLTYDGVHQVVQRKGNLESSIVAHSLGGLISRYALPFLSCSTFEQTAAETAHLIVGRTGKHLFLSDRDDGKPPLRKYSWLSTSSIRRQHELPKLELTAIDEKYPHVIPVDIANSEGLKEMIRGLKRVTWERVDVRTPMNLEGEDVIYHMIDNFLV
ncbi:hypothetical protein ZWY2020_027839 [Hordeum vulgare]|nr:hypothetical protein ZWY2020_027839 [Hordeum vulgare]